MGIHLYLITKFPFSCSFRIVQTASVQRDTSLQQNINFPDHCSLKHSLIAKTWRQLKTKKWDAKTTAFQFAQLHFLLSNLALYLHESKTTAILLEQTFTEQHKRARATGWGERQSKSRSLPSCSLTRRQNRTEEHGGKQLGAEWRTNKFDPHTARS